MSSPLRLCRYCAKPFRPSRFHPAQAVCSNKACQDQRRAASRAQKLSSDAEYREVCRDSARKWRAGNKDYWKQYRERNPQSAAQNRNQQRQRDERQRLLDLANNNLASGLKSFDATVWIFDPSQGNLANNNLAPSKVVILQRDPRKPAGQAASCKQHPSGLERPFCPTTEEAMPSPLANSC
jgi:hypothetical protein